MTQIGFWKLSLLLVWYCVLTMCILYHKCVLITSRALKILAFEKRALNQHLLVVKAVPFRQFIRKLLSKFKTIELKYWLCGIVLKFEFVSLKPQLLLKRNFLMDPGTISKVSKFLIIPLRGCLHEIQNKNSFHHEKKSCLNYFSLGGKWNKT